MGKSKTAPKEKKRKKAKTPKTEKYQEGVQSKEIEKTMLFKLTKDDKARILDRRTELEEEIETLQADAKKAADEFKNKIAPLTLELDNLSDVARAGEEERTVKCVCEMDFLNGEVRYVVDGKVHEKRTMTQDEYQLEIHVGSRAKNRGTQDLPQTEEKATDAEGQSIADAIAEETSKKTKHSSVDGPRPH